MADESLIGAGGADLDRMAQQMQDMQKTAGDFSRVLNAGLRTAVVSGKSLDSVMKSMVLSLSSRTLSSALAPLTNLAGNAVSSLLGSAASSVASGVSGLFSSGVSLFADGGVVSSPTFFGHGSGLGLMGEAGAEAILPLQRGADGRLGVAGPGGSGGGTVVVNVTTPDAPSFRRSEAQVSAMVARAVGRGRRGL